MTIEQKKYHAFISYRHADNKVQGRQWATSMHQAIETYEIPADLVGKSNGRGEKIPAQIYPIFRDEEELPADSNLGNAVQKALDNSGLLIVICSPRAVASTYVAEEIDYFKKLGRSERIIASIIDGEPNASWDKGKQKSGFKVEDECFPIPLQFEYDDKGNRTSNHAEPIAADFRINNNGRPEQGWTNPEAYRQHLKESTKLNAQVIKEKVGRYQQQQHLMFLKIIAGIIGVPLSELTQRDKEYQLAQEQKKAKRLRQWIGALSLLVIIAIGLGAIAYYQKNKTEEAKEETEKQLVEANHNFGLILHERAKKEIEKKNFGLAAYLSALALTYLQTSESSAESSGIWLKAISGPSVIWSSIPVKNFSNNIMEGIFSPNGNYLAFALRNNNLQLLNLKNGEISPPFKGHSAYVRSMIFSPDSTILVSASEDQTLRLWVVNSSNLMKKITGDFHDIAFSPDGKTLALGSRNDTIRLWNITDNNIKEHKGQYDDIRNIVFSPDGNILASTSGDKVISLLNISSNSVKNIEGHSGHIASIAFSPDSKIIASGLLDNTYTGSLDDTINLWDTKNGNFISNINGHSDDVRSIAFSSDGKRLVSGSDDNTIRLWNVENAMNLSTLTGHRFMVSHVSFSPDDKTILSREPSDLLLWDIMDNKLCTTFVAHPEGSVNTITLSPDGNTIASGSNDNTIRLWDFKTGKAISAPINGSNSIYSIAFSPNGKTLASGSYDKTIRLWDLKTGKNKVILKGHSSYVNSVAFSPDGKFLASGSSDTTIRLWEVQTGQLIKILKGHSEFITSVAFSPDGKIIASGSGDSSTRLWNINTGKLISTLINGKGGVESIAFSPDGMIIASGSRDYNVRLWSVNTGKLIAIMIGHKSAVNSVSFSPDAKILASGSLDRTIHLWDGKNGNPISIINHSHSVNSVIFSNDSKQIISGNGNKMISIQNIQLLSQILNEANRKQWLRKQEQLIGFYLDGIDVKIKRSNSSDTLSPSIPSWSPIHPFHWLSKAKQGDNEAMLQLGIIYHRDSNWDKAKEWYQKALDAGHSNAKKRLIILEKTRLYAQIKDESKQNDLMNRIDRDHGSAD